MTGFQARWVEIYYWATPLFALLDGVFGANVRAVGLAEQPGLRAGYYLLCLVCAIVAWGRPGWSTVVGLAESSLNLFLLILSILLPYWGLINAVLGDGPPVHSPLHLSHMVNFLVAGTVWTVLFYERMLAMGRVGLLRAS